MMKLRDYKKYLLVSCLLLVQIALGQYKIEGIVKDQKGNVIPKAEIYNQSNGEQTIGDQNGYFLLEGLEEGTYQITVFSFDFEISEKKVVVTSDTKVDFVLEPLGEELSEVMITQRRKKIFGLQQLKPVEGTAIYAGKKSEVVLLENTLGNLATNNARQVYAQVAGLNIYENSIGGLQLNIGGRGLDPNRTANFNTRQNGYDISADVLGYPESYYTPPTEALSEIQVVRGAASLQYGTQFGGLINFKMKPPNPTKKIEWVSRQTLGSFDLITSFNSLSGTLGKFSYYTYFNYKEGSGFRPNSEFDSKNAYAYFGYQVSKKTKATFETTYLDYLAQQPGGLTDTQFDENPDFSNRTRNWFEVNWKLFSLRLEHKFSKQTDFSLNLFTLDASRKAVGFRGIPGNLNINPITAVDEIDTEGNFVNERDIIIGDFKNWGAEVRLLSTYSIRNQESVFLIGSKYYQADNFAAQGAGSLGTDPNFDIQNLEFPDYPNRSAFDFPNLNIAVFGENIFTLSDRFTLTPGVRFEYIKTGSEGFYNDVTFDNAGNVIANSIETESDELERSFMLLGLGASYKINDAVEAYANLSQNYRSVTFNDIRIVSPSFEVREDISDEKGGTADLGIRGKIYKDLSYDINVFGLLYSNRIAEVTNNRAKRERGNIGDAYIYGLESFMNWNIANTLFSGNKNYVLNSFVNLAITESRYSSSEIAGVVGNKVEFIPLINLKTGIGFGYKNFLSNLQFTYLSEQFTEVSNAERAPQGSLEEGIKGKIPSYGILDLSLSYSYKIFKLETGVNNILNTSYYTQRATGYPGPGIIPSEPLTWYATLQFSL